MSDAPEVPFASTLAPLAPWLAERLGATDLVIGSADRPSSGFSAETVVYLRELVASGARLHGASDPSFERVHVLVEG